MTTCRICGDSGQMLALLKRDPRYEFAFACGYCGAAERRGYKTLPQWTEACEAKYVKVSLKRDSYIAACQLRQRAFEKYHRRDTGREGVQQVPAEQTAGGVLRDAGAPGETLGAVPGVPPDQEQGVLPREPPADPGSAEGLSDDAWQETGYQPDA